MTTYRIVVVPTTDAAHLRYVIMESKNGEERVVSEHGTEEDAAQYLGELRERDFFWRKSNP